MRSIRIAAWSAIAFLAVAAGALGLWRLQEAARGTAALPGVAAIGGPFQLIDQDGRPFASTDLAGLPFAMFFGFTQCPDVCPTTLLEMSHHLVALGPDADRIRMVFVSVDPERDTAAHLKAYLSAFDPRIIGLTGSVAQIAEIARRYRVLYEMVPTSGGYTINHTATVFLMDAAGRLASTLSFQEEEAAQRRKLSRLAEASPVPRRPKAP